MDYKIAKKFTKEVLRKYGLTSFRVMSLETQPEHIFLKRWKQRPLIIMETKKLALLNKSKIEATSEKFAFSYVEYTVSRLWKRVSCHHRSPKNDNLDFPEMSKLQ